MSKTLIEITESIKGSFKFIIRFQKSHILKDLAGKSQGLLNNGDNGSHEQE